MHLTNMNSMKSDELPFLELVSQESIEGQVNPANDQDAHNSKHNHLDSH